MIVRHEPGIGDDFERGEIAKLTFSVLLDALDDDFYVAFRGTTSLDIGKTASDAGMRLLRDGL